MTQKELHLKSIMDTLIGGHLLEREAASMAHKSLRQIQRIKRRYIQDGDIGLIHRSRLRASNHQYDESKYYEAVSLIEKYYRDYSYVLIQEKLEEKHGITLSMPTLRNELIRRGIRVVKTQRKPDFCRTMRVRKENFGEMVQYDGTYHLWFEDRGEEACLLVAVDDATGDVVLRFDINEGIRATFEFWIDYILIYGKPKSIYLDRFATYKINHPNATDDKELVTQFGRVCKELGIELIFANSPQAKGRVERMNKTLQDRLLKELRENGIRTIADANVFLKEFLPKFNKKFHVEARGSSNLHIPLREDERLRLSEIFSLKDTRKVRNDYTISFETKTIQLYRDKEGGSIVYNGDIVTTEKHMNGTVHIRNKNGRLIYSKEIQTTSRRTYTLTLPPLISEDESILKKQAREAMEAKEQYEREESMRKEREKQKRDELRFEESKRRQVYYQKKRAMEEVQKIPTPILPSTLPQSSYGESHRLTLIPK